jgi:hypothetical protein
MSCQICFESFPTMYKVTCGSTVDHEICFECETQWRAKMKIRDGKRVMSCPTCRQEETSRTMDSLERELAALYVSSRPVMDLGDAIRIIFALNAPSRTYVAHRILATTVASEPETRPVRPELVLCASGRECVTRSRVNSRVKTHLKCRTCSQVACCSKCRICTGCQPLA